LDEGERPTSGRLIVLRRARFALVAGNYLPVAAIGDVLAYWRQHGAERLLIVLNFGRQACSFTVPWEASFRILLSTDPQRTDEIVGPELAMHANEGLILEPK
jgi:alpha-glucosidase